MTNPPTPPRVSPFEPVTDDELRGFKIDEGDTGTRDALNFLLAVRYRRASLDALRTASPDAGPRFTEEEIALVNELRVEEEGIATAGQLYGNKAREQSQQRAVALDAIASKMRGQTATTPELSTPREQAFADEAVQTLRDGITTEGTSLTVDECIALVGIIEAGRRFAQPSTAGPLSRQLSEEEKLVAFFRSEEGDSLGRQGDHDNLSPAETAVRAMRELLGTERLTQREAAALLRLGVSRESQKWAVEINGIDFLRAVEKLRRLAAHAAPSDAASPTAPLTVLPEEWERRVKEEVDNASGWDNLKKRFKSALLDALNANASRREG